MQLEQRNTQQLDQVQRCKRLLVVDDEPAMRQLCLRALDHFEITPADDGQAALKRLGEERFDVVLTDVNMPKLDGLELLQAVKQADPSQLVILITGYSDKETVLRALKAGADDFISKPVNLLQLRTTINKAIEKKALRDELASLRRLDQLKSEFLGLISHKLRTPATAISLFVQNMAAADTDIRDPAFRQTLEMVQAETSHLEHLIQDLLYFSDAILQQDELRLEKVDLGQLARQIVQLCKPLAEKKEVHLSVDIPASFAAQPMTLDRARINFVLRALLDNAIKFTPAEGSVQLRGELADDCVRLSVHDTGPGIPAGEIKEVFNKFYQVDPAFSGQIRGFGLGLFYARQFAQSLQGRVDLICPPDCGTVATIELPLSH